MKNYIVTSNSSAGLMPFLEEALLNEIVELDSSYEVHMVVETRKRSGWLIKCDKFQIFIYKSSPIADAMTECLQELVKLNPSQALNVELNDSTVEGFSLWIDDEELRMWTKSKKSNVLDAFQCHKISVETKRKKAAG